MARSNRDGAYEEREAYRVRVAAGLEFDDFDDNFDDLVEVDADDLIYDHDDYMAEKYFLI